MGRGEAPLVVVEVGPCGLGSLLATTMMKDARGVAGSDTRIGAEIRWRAALGEDFAG